MTRAALYARYSTDLQDRRSIDDQLALCRGFAEREGLAIVAGFSDAARSGASVVGRDGLLALMQAARAGAFLSRRAGFAATADPPLSISAIVC